MSIKLISKHRSALMAVAMFWIALEHSYFPVHNKLISFVFVKCGYGGVSLFAFLSAFGLYYSYKKDSNYLHFIKRRLLKILPYSIPMGFIYAYFYEDSLFHGFVDGFGLSLLFRANLTNWFTSFILFVYFVTPLYLKIFNKKPLIVTIISIIIVTFVCLFCDVSWDFRYVWFHLTICCMGFYFAYLNDLDIKINYTYMCILFCLFLFGWFLMYYLYHNWGNDIKHIYPMFFITPGMILACAYLLDKMGFVTNILKKIGAYTYQFYLIHRPLVIYLLYKNYMLFYIQGINFDFWINVVAMIIAYILSVIYKKTIDLLINRKEIKNT